MNIEFELKNLPRTKMDVELLRHQYDDWLNLSEQLKKHNSRSAKLCYENSEEIYAEIQKKLKKYKTIIGMIQSFTDFKGLFLQLHFIDGHSLKYISEMTNHGLRELRKIKKEILKAFEECADLVTE